MKNIFRRGLALALAMVMVLGLGVSGVQAAPSGITFEKLDNVSTDLFGTGAVVENQNEKLHADTDMVRVMIVLEGEPAVGKLKGGENFTANMDAVNYREQLHAEQLKTAEIISKVLLFAEDGKIKDPMILEGIRK